VKAEVAITSEPIDRGGFNSGELQTIDVAVHAAIEALGDEAAEKTVLGVASGVQERTGIRAARLGDVRDTDVAKLAARAHFRCVYARLRRRPFGVLVRLHRGDGSRHHAPRSIAPPSQHSNPTGWPRAWPRPWLS
jgi:hypothetical protein